MREVDGLWVWAHPHEERLYIGNRAAAEAARDETSKASALTPRIAVPSGIPVPSHCRTLGVFGLDETAKFELQAYADLTGLGQLQRFLKPMQRDMDAEKIASQSTLTFAPLGDPTSPTRPETWPDRGLWRDDVLVAHGPLAEPDAATPGFNVAFEMLKQMAAHHDVCAILHGAAVQWRGKRLVLLGVSGAGKSTLAARLVADGGTYLADDAIVLLRDGRVIPVPLAPSVKESAWEVLQPFYPELASEEVYTKGELRLKYLPNAPYATDTGPVDLLVFPQFSLDHPPKTVVLHLVETLLYLSKSGIWMEPEAMDEALDFFEKTPAIALRQTPDFSATQSLLADALARQP